MERIFPNGECLVSEVQKQHTEKPQQKLNCQTLGDSRELYLETDAPLLACISEEFHKLCHKTYDLNMSY